ncbi:MAG TPA: helical backbone metal receptor [Spirochaetota bacterium]|nr:helical backbone metal receptor [Spirochaetota bacterium]HQP48595.1 helical backbone metal receptor [Spirochaetota bacterium]
MRIQWHAVIAPLVAAAALIIIYTGDDDGEQVCVPRNVRRVVSLSPSVTREIIDLGAEEMLAGVTSYHPPMKKKVPVVGTILHPNVETILSLGPDLVLYSEEDSAVQHAERLAAAGLCAVSLGRNRNFEEICANYLRIAELIGARDAGREKISRYRALLNVARVTEKRCTVAVFIAHTPLVAASEGSFVGEIIADSGGINVVKDTGIGYPILSAEFLIAVNPDVILSIMPGAAEFFLSLSGSAPGLRATEKGQVYTINERHLAYYTPGDYIAAVREIAALLKKVVKQDENRN